MKKRSGALIATLLVLTFAAGGAAAEQMAVGDILTFGTYEQDNDMTNGAEPIEWQVLAVEEGDVLVISRYALETRAYQSQSVTYPTWGKSEVRSWLNGAFLENAFADSEREALVLSSVTTADFTPYGSATTEDYLFLLSREEATDYFTTNDDREAVPTDFAAAQGAARSKKYTKDGVMCCMWWLRTSSFNSESADIVRRNGVIGYIGVSGTRECVRPAMRLNPDALGE